MKTMLHITTIDHAVHSYAVGRVAQERPENTYHFVHYLRLQIPTDYNNHYGNS